MWKSRCPKYSKWWNFGANLVKKGTIFKKAAKKGGFFSPKSRFLCLPNRRTYRGQGMTDVVLTLQLPKGNRFIPIAMTADRTVLVHFKAAVLEQWRQQVEMASDEVEALTQRAEFDRLKRLLNALIPTINGGDHEGS